MKSKSSFSFTSVFFISDCTVHVIRRKRKKKTKTTQHHRVMKSLKRTFLFILGFFYLPKKMLTESFNKSVSLKLTASISLLTEKKKKIIAFSCSSLKCSTSLHIDLTRNVALHLLHNIAWLAVLSIRDQNC